jgi:hypothetical protein
VLPGDPPDALVQAQQQPRVPPDPAERVQSGRRRAVGEPSASAAASSSSNRTTDASS